MCVIIGPIWYLREHHLDPRETSCKINRCPAVRRTNVCIRRRMSGLDSGCMFFSWKIVSNFSTLSGLCLNNLRKFRWRRSCRTKAGVGVGMRGLQNPVSGGISRSLLRGVSARGLFLYRHIGATNLNKIYRN